MMPSAAPSSLAERLTRRIAELRPFVGAVILHLESNTRFRIMLVHVRASDSEVCFLYEAISPAACDRIPLSRPVTEIIGNPRFEFIAGEYRPRKVRNSFIPKHVLSI